MKSLISQLSNSEVLEILEGSFSVREKSSSQLKHRDYVEEKVIGYLKSTPCSKLDASRREELIGILEGSKKAKTDDGSKSSGYKFSKTEVIALLNHLPQEPVDIHLLIDELSDKLSEEQQDELLELISRYRTVDADATKIKTEDGVKVKKEVKVELEM